MKGSEGAPLRVTIVGYGLAGAEFHAPLVSATPGLVVDTIVTADPERWRRAEAAYPQARLAISVDEVWSRALEVLEAARLSARERRTVRLA